MLLGENFDDIHQMCALYLWIEAGFYLKVLTSRACLEWYCLWGSACKSNRKPDWVWYMMEAENRKEKAAWEGSIYSVQYLCFEKKEHEILFVLLASFGKITKSETEMSVSCMYFFPLFSSFSSFSFSIAPLSYLFFIPNIIHFVLFFF